MLSEISQEKEKDKYYMVSLICRVKKKKVKLIETDYKNVDAGGWGK